MNLKELLESVKLWHVSMFIATCLLLLGATGEIPFTDMKLSQGLEDRAIRGGIIFYLFAIVFIYMPPSGQD